MQTNLSPEKHINKITRETYQLLINIRTAFHYMDEDMMKKLIVTVLWSRMEYAAVVWTPHKKKDIRKIERIQRTATKMVPGLKDLSYEDRLSRMNLPTLEERRERGDLIAVYRGMKGIDKIDEGFVRMGRERYARTQQETEENKVPQRCQEIQLPIQMHRCME